MQNHEPYLVNLNEDIPVDGSPLIYIEGKKALKKKDPNHLELDNNMTLSVPIQQELNFSFQTPFHHPAQAGMVDHVSDLVSIVQPLDPETVMVTEDLIQLNTQSNRKFARTITLPDKASFELILFTQNGKATMPYQVKLNHSDMVLLGTDNMDVGPNKIHLRYLIKNPFTFDEDKATLNLHLTGNNFFLPINRLQALVLFPLQTEIFNKQLLFGSNKQQVPEAFESTHDKQGNVTYRSTHLIPAQTDIQTDLTFEKQALPQDTLIERIFASQITFIFILAIILSLYWFASVYWDTHKPLPTYIPTVLKDVTLAEIRVLFNVSNTLAFLNNVLICNNNNYIKSLIKILHHKPLLVLYKIYLHLRTFISISGEICLGTIVLIIITNVITSMIITPLSYELLAGIIIISFLIILILYMFFLQPYYRKVLVTYAHMAMDVEKLPLLTNNQIRSLAPLMMATKRYEAWQALLKKYNPNYLIQNTGDLQ
ncbi:MAG: DUF2207 domain-containing protein [Alphaproteobacteria bacterium]|nr:DUF2207 domain-containing protein [Alphaproteobacteria bacterium]